jgi:hypothetical protein
MDCAFRIIFPSVYLPKAYTQYTRYARTCVVCTGHSSELLTSCRNVDVSLWSLKISLLVSTFLYTCNILQGSLSEARRCLLLPTVLLCNPLDFIFQSLLSFIFSLLFCFFSTLLFFVLSIGIEAKFCSRTRETK